MKAPQVEVVADRRGVNISIMEFDRNGMGSGVSTRLSRKAAITLAELLNDALDGWNGEAFVPTSKVTVTARRKVRVMTDDKPIPEGLIQAIRRRGFKVKR